MTLLELIQTLKAEALAQPTVKLVVDNDMARLNGIADAEYGVFGYKQNTHSAVGDWMNYSFTLYYADRLLNDKSNENEILSAGMLTLDNILLAVEESGVVIGNAQYTTDVVAYADECAVVACDVTLSVTRPSLCRDIY